MRESTVQAHLMAEVKRLKGQARRLQWIGRSRAQDVFVALNGAWLVECKRPGEKEHPGQARERKRLSACGVRCRVVSTIEEVDAFIHEAYNASSDC